MTRKTYKIPCSECGQLVAIETTASHVDYKIETLYGYFCPCGHGDVWHNEMTVGPISKKVGKYTLVLNQFDATIRVQVNCPEVGNFDELAHFMHLENAQDTYEAIADHSGVMMLLDEMY